MVDVPLNVQDSNPDNARDVGPGRNRDIEEQIRHAGADRIDQFVPRSAEG